MMHCSSATLLIVRENEMVRFLRSIEMIRSANMEEEEKRA